MTLQSQQRAAPRKKLDKTLSVIVPVYNEAAIIHSSISRMAASLDQLFERYEIVIVESGSTDGTGALVDALAREIPQVRSLHQAAREGMGSAIRYGIAEAKMDYLFWTDGDHPIEMTELHRVLEVEDADLIAGYRLTRREGFKRYLYSRVFNLMINSVYRLGLRDINFAFKVYRRRLFDSIRVESQGSFFAAELCIKANARGFRLKEVGIPYQSRDSGDSKLGNLSTVWGILRDWWRLRNRLTTPRVVDTAPVPLTRCPLCGSAKLAPFVEDIVECLDCRYALRVTSHSHDEMKSWYGDEYWSGTTGYTSYEDDWFAHRVNFTRLVNRIRKECPSGSLLELGCASGHFLKVAQRAFTVQGVELSEPAARQARAAGFHVRQGEFLAHADEFPADAFDVVCMWDTIEHVDRPLDYLAAIHRVLKPGGVLMFSTPDRESWMAARQKASWRHYAPVHLHYFGRNNIRKALDARGFSGVRVEHLSVHRSLTQLIVGALFFGRAESSASKALQRVMAKLPPMSIGLNLRDIMVVTCRKP